MEREPCTECCASWCPNCGDCTCPKHDDGEPVIRTVEPATIVRMWPVVEVMHDADCPLHSTASKHGEEVTP